MTPAENKAERPLPDAANPDAIFQPIPPDAYIFSQLRNLGRTILTIEEYERLERDSNVSKFACIRKYGMMCDREEALSFNILNTGLCYRGRCTTASAQSVTPRWISARGRESTIIVRRFNGCSKEISTPNWRWTKQALGPSIASRAKTTIAAHPFLGDQPTAAHSSRAAKTFREVR